MNDEQIINAIKLSPQTCIDYAIQIYGGAVKVICKAILAAYSDEDIEEAVSDTFFALWHDIGKYDVSKASFKSYIYGIARNCANNKARRIRKQGKTLPIDNADEAVTNQDVEYDAISKINSDIMLDIISHMKPPQGKVFIYKYIDGMSIKEISETLSVKEKDVQNILYRGKKKLRKFFEQRGIL